MHPFRATIVGIAASLAAVAVSYPQDLTFDQRVACQRSIEAVYWENRAWPSGRSQPKPHLDEVMPRSAVAAKVEDSLRKSAALDKYWRRPITGAQLQAEINRMTRDTRQADVLGQLFQALGNDPQKIAECLARPLLAERLIRAWYARDERVHGALRGRVEYELIRINGSVGAMKQLSGVYSETEWIRGAAVGVQDEAKGSRRRPRIVDGQEWDRLLRRLTRVFDRADPGDPGLISRRSADRLPRARSGDRAILEEIPVGMLTGLTETDDRFQVMAVLSKSPGRIIVANAHWPKQGFDLWWADAAAQAGDQISVPAYLYVLPEVSPASCPGNSWTPTNFMPPAGRTDHTAIWTGSEMIVWGGYSGFYENTGSRYTPAIDNWAPLPAMEALAGRRSHTAVWSGSEMIVWGGVNTVGGLTFLNDGGRYSPLTDSWRLTSMSEAPSPRYGHAAVWTGSKMIAWGGSGGAYEDTGGVYDPGTDTWLATSTLGAPTARYLHTAVWNGSEMIVWGGETSSSNQFDTGGRYDPATDSWTSTNTTGAPSARRDHTAIWSGTEMIVWGGRSGTYENTGGRYDPGTNSWRATATSGSPDARGYHTVVWSGTEMIVWGGFTGSFENTGARYNPVGDSWITVPTSGAPRPRYLHAAIWTGSEMVVWGGSDGGRMDSGGRYSPAGDSWVPTSNSYPPEARHSHTAVWTGAEMIVWGGASSSFDGAELQTGGRYNPSTNSWIPTSISGAPSARESQTGVWTGSEMIVWGGYSPRTEAFHDTGGRYSPATDSWIATSLTDAPAPRSAHTAVWSGERMIVWGGATALSIQLDTGGLYDPATGLWASTTTTGAPAARRDHTAVWTGSEMFVWGGYGGGVRLNTGSGYDPTTGSWAAIADAGAPEIRALHTAVWIGSEMIVWGGYGGTDSVGNLQTGGRYNPGSSSWFPTATSGAPSARSEHTAVWTGSEMIVWGGSSATGPENSGGRYFPVDDSWGATPTAGAPMSRYRHTAVLTSSQMIVWGGLGSDASGGGYCACTESNPTSEVASDLSFSDNETLVWTEHAGITTYNLYRGSMESGEWIFDHHCRAPDLTTTSATDSSLPLERTGYFYLVSGCGECGEGLLGHASDGSPTPNPAPCP